MTTAFIRKRTYGNRSATRGTIHRSSRARNTTGKRVRSLTASTRGVRPT
jgi:hypothetical protein